MCGHTEITSHPRVYDTIGNGYRDRRIPDQRIASQIRMAIGEASSVCNVGAGTGSYEPADLRVTAVEPSEKMAKQRGSWDGVVRACAERLPFNDRAFDVAMSVLSVHHWENAAAGLQEMARISRRQVILTFDPLMVSSLWLVRDYLPEIAEFERMRAQPMDVFAQHLNVIEIQDVLIPWDCTDGFQAAYWRRPESYLEADVRAAISTFAQLPARVTEPAIRRLRNDLSSGDWHKRHARLLTCDAVDFGYRLVVAESVSRPHRGHVSGDGVRTPYLPRRWRP